MLMSLQIDILLVFCWRCGQAKCCLFRKINCSSNFLSVLILQRDRQHEKAHVDVWRTTIYQQNLILSPESPMWRRKKKIPPAWADGSSGNVHICLSLLSVVVSNFSKWMRFIEDIKDESIKLYQINFLSIFFQHHDKATPGRLIFVVYWK